MARISYAHAAVFVLVCSLFATARADVVFFGNATESLTVEGAFRIADPNFDNTTILGPGSATINSGAEGELEAGANIVPNGTTRAGTVTFVVSRNFTIVGGLTTVDHLLRADGEWSVLKTRDDVDAFYDLGITYTDEILQGNVVRSKLRDDDMRMETGANVNKGPAAINLRGAEKGIPLPVGQYTLRSTIELGASYQDAKWRLNLRDVIFDPRGVGFGSDKQGFNSTVVAVPVPTALPLGLIGLMLVGSVKRRWAQG